ncbi:MAG: penicillin-binding transpeptidase domain-containing protein, partial [Pseudomonadota bacterium]|nr:penicillin-binding transpeptidase domain-containing protein [Pseudomonadota bacterium]
MTSSPWSLNRTDTQSISSQPPTFFQRWTVWLTALLMLSCVSTSHAAKLVERPDWADVFAAQAVDGTIAILDQRTQPATQFVYHPTRAATRYSPASTFKIPHTLFALDAGVVRDTHQTFQWDGIPRSFAGHNQDQNLCT